MFLLNTLKNADIIFFIVCAAIIVLIVAVWFLLPVFNKRQYKDQRDSLRKREAAFRSNLNANNTQTTTENNSVAISSEEMPENNQENNTLEENKIE